MRRAREAVLAARLQCAVWVVAPCMLCLSWLQLCARMGPAHLCQVVAEAPGILRGSVQ
jgi:hypothetical protein